MSVADQLSMEQSQTTDDYFAASQAQLGPVSYQEWKAANNQLFWEIKDQRGTSYSEKEKWQMYENYIGSQGLSDDELGMYLADEPEWGASDSWLSSLNDAVDDTFGSAMHSTGDFIDKYDAEIAGGLILGGTAASLMGGGAATAGGTTAPGVTAPTGAGFTGTATNGTVGGLTAGETAAGVGIANTVANQGGSSFESTEFGGGDQVFTDPDSNYLPTDSDYKLNPDSNLLDINPTGGADNVLDLSGAGLTPDNQEILDSTFGPDAVLDPGTVSLINDLENEGMSFEEAVQFTSQLPDMGVPPEDGFDFFQALNDLGNFNSDGSWGGLLDLLSAGNQLYAADQTMEGVDDYLDEMNTGYDDYISDVDAGYEDARGSIRYGYNKAIGETRDQLGLNDELFQPYLDAGERATKQYNRGLTIGGYDRRLNRIMGTDSFQGLRDQRTKDMTGHLSNVGLSRSKTGLRELAAISPELAMEIEGTLHDRAYQGMNTGATAAANKGALSGSLNSVLANLLTGRADAHSRLKTDRANAIAKANLDRTNINAKTGLAAANTWTDSLQNILNLFSTQGKNS